MNKPPESIGRWLTTKEAAKHIRQSVHTVRKWRTKQWSKRKQYDLRPFKRGTNGRVYYWEPFLNRWMEQWALHEQSLD